MMGSNRRIMDFSDEELAERVQRERRLLSDALEDMLVEGREVVSLAQEFAALLNQTLTEVEVRLRGGR